ncbi:helicase associated domain-containing protein [Streptomyces cinerochromogenes]|uniref:helicase associated domain-containing protein n=1 Tax=Streptomyces cinerochromogenes TaxID=66422 RepID=UPI0036A7AF70
MAVDWQRTYAAVARLVALGAGVEEIVPGATSGAVDVGRWLARQRDQVVWEGLAEGQREHLTALGVTPLPPEQKTPVRAPRGGSGGFERGCAALAQYRALTGTTGLVSRSHIETLPDGTEVKLGVFLANTKTRRAKLSAAQLQQLAALGLQWAEQTPSRV